MPAPNARRLDPLSLFALGEVLADVALAREDGCLCGDPTCTGATAADPVPPYGPEVDPRCVTCGRSRCDGCAS